MNVKSLARLCVDPFAVDESLLLEQRWVVELQNELALVL